MAEAVRSGFSLGASAEKRRSLSNSTHEQEMFFLIVIKWFFFFWFHTKDSDEWENDGEKWDLEN